MNQGAAVTAQPLALCLSGGGFRATLFHLGTLRRLNELGILSRCDTITSVSGGSILNGRLAAAWDCLESDERGYLSNFEERIAEPIRTFCRRDLRTRMLLLSRLNPLRWPRLLWDGFSINGNYLAHGYRDLYLDKKMREVPAPRQGIPRFVFCATNLSTGACWQAHAGVGGRMGDFYIGYLGTEDLTIADAVAASSAFPPGFAPLSLDVTGKVFERQDPWGKDRSAGTRPPTGPCSQIFLTDGGVYDNLGLEPLVNNPHVTLVSDAGSPFASETHPKRWLVGRMIRSFLIAFEQVGAVRKRWLIEDFASKKKLGAFWGIGTRLSSYSSGVPFAYSDGLTGVICGIRTDLNDFSQLEMACLENHGYAQAEAAIRNRMPGLIRHERAFALPYPDCTDEEILARGLVDSHLRSPALYRLNHFQWPCSRP